MRKVTSPWILHQLTDVRKQQGVRYCGENLQNSMVVPFDYVTLLQVMRHESTRGKLDTSQQMQAGLAKVNHQSLLFVTVNLKPKNFLYLLGIKWSCS